MSFIGDMKRVGPFKGQSIYLVKVWLTVNNQHRSSIMPPLVLPDADPLLL